MLEVCHLEGHGGGQVHGGCRHETEGGHGHGGHEGGLGGIDAKVDGRRLQRAAAVRGAEVWSHAHSALGERVLGEGVGVDVHPGGQHGVHGLHGGGETEADGLEGRDGGRGGHRVVGGGAGDGVDASLVLVLVLGVVGAAVVLVRVVLRHGAGRDGQRPRLVGEGEGLAVGVERGVKGSLHAAVKGAVEVDVLILHGVCTEEEKWRSSVVNSAARS